MVLFVKHWLQLVRGEAEKLVMIFCKTIARMFTYTLVVIYCTVYGGIIYIKHIFDCAICEKC